MLAFAATVAPPKALAEHDVLILFVAFVVFVGLGRLLGELALRLRQPQVLGEILAGVLLGPSVLGLLAPSLYRAFAIPGAQLVEPLSWLGIIFLLTLTAIDLNLARLRRQSRTAPSISIGGIVVAFAAGLAFGELAPGSLVGSGGTRITFAIFLGTAMSISAVTVIAKVLADLRQLHRDASRVILAGGVFDETIGYVLLALVTGLVSATKGNGFDPARVLDVIGAAVGFLIVALLFGRRIVERVVRVVHDHARLDDATLTVTALLAVASAAITEFLGLHQVLGAFVFGLIAGSVLRIDRRTTERLRSTTRTFLVPLFFVLAGMKVDLRTLADPHVAEIALLFFLVASAAKIGGSILGGCAGGERWRDALLVGIGMNVRGSMEIIVAVIAFQVGIVGQTMFSVIVLLSVLTILTTPSLLRVAFDRIPPSDEERARLDRDAILADGYARGLRRVLIPIFPRAPTEVGLEAARAIARAKATATEPVEIAVLRLPRGPDDGEVARPVTAPLAVSRLHEAARFEPVIVEERASGRGDAVAAIVRTAERGYDLIVAGAPRPHDNARLFDPQLDGVIHGARADVLVVSSTVGFTFEGLRRIVAPVTAKPESLAGAEFAIALAAGIGATVVALHAVRELPLDGALAHEQRRRHRVATDGLMERLRRRADAMAVALEERVTPTLLPAQTILTALEAPDVGLCIVGVGEPEAETSSLGDTTDLLLRLAPTPVGVLIVR